MTLYTCTLVVGCTNLSWLNSECFLLKKPQLFRFKERSKYCTCILLLCTSSSHSPSLKMLLILLLFIPITMYSIKGCKKVHVNLSWLVMHHFVKLFQVFNISVSYNAILGVILAFAAAIASRIILDELSMWEDHAVDFEVLFCCKYSLSIYIYKYTHL